MSQEVLQEPETHMLYFKLVGINLNKQLKHPNFPYSSTIRQKESSFYRCCPIKSSQITQPLLQFAKEKRLTDNSSIIFICNLVYDSSVTSAEEASFHKCLFEFKDWKVLILLVYIEGKVNYLLMQKNYHSVCEAYFTLIFNNELQYLSFLSDQSPIVALPCLHITSAGCPLVDPGVWGCWAHTTSPY